MKTKVALCILAAPSLLWTLMSVPICLFFAASSLDFPGVHKGVWYFFVGTLGAFGSVALVLSLLWTSTRRSLQGGVLVCGLGCYASAMAFWTAHEWSTPWSAWKHTYTEPIVVTSIYFTGILVAGAKAFEIYSQKRNEA